MIQYIQNIFSTCNHVFFYILFFYNFLSTLNSLYFHTFQFKLDTFQVFSSHMWLLSQAKFLPFSFYPQNDPLCFLVNSCWGGSFSRSVLCLQGFWSVFLHRCWSPSGLLAIGDLFPPTRILGFEGYLIIYYISFLGLS